MKYRFFLLHSFFLFAVTVSIIHFPLKAFGIIEETRRRFADAWTCTTERPMDDDALFALAMQNYWKREVQSLWQQDANLNKYYRGAKGRIHVTDRDCGLIRDTSGHPLHIDRNTCYPWKLVHYNTLESVAERLKVVSQFGVERGFDRPDSREGGWIYDEIVQNLLHGEAYPPNGKPLYLPKHNGHADFAVLYKRGNAVRWYGTDCCALMNYEQAHKEYGIRSQPGHAISIDHIGQNSKLLPTGILREDLRILRVSYHDVDFNLDSGQGGVYALARGELDDYNMNITKYFLISPCGEIICLGWPGTCD